MHIIRVFDWILVVVSISFGWMLFSPFLQFSCSIEIFRVKGKGLLGKYKRRLFWEKQTHHRHHVHIIINLIIVFICQYNARYSTFAWVTIKSSCLSRDIQWVRMMFYKQSPLLFISYVWHWHTIRETVFVWVLLKYDMFDVSPEGNYFFVQIGFTANRDNLTEGEANEMGKEQWEFSIMLNLFLKINILDSEI